MDQGFTLEDLLILWLRAATGTLHAGRLPLHTFAPQGHSQSKQSADSNKQEKCYVSQKKLTITNTNKIVKGGRGHLAHEGLVGVAELAQVQQGLHHRLLQSCLCLLVCVLVPVDVAP